MKMAEWSGVDSSPHQYMHLAVFCKESTGVQWNPVESIWTLGGTAKYCYIAEIEKGCLA